MGSLPSRSADEPPSAEDAPLLLTRVADHVGTMTLNRPEQLNVLTRALLSALDGQLAAWRNDKSVRVIVLAAKGKAYCAGHDLKDMAGSSRQPVEDLLAQCTEVMEAIRLHPKPVIAQVHANAAAAGCQLVASCDLAVASEQARFGTSGINAGLFCFTPMVPLSRVVNSKKSLEMLLTGTLISAEEALQVGLINRVVAPEALEQETTALAAKIAAHSPYAVQSGKAAFYRQRGMDVADAYAVGQAGMVSNVLAPDGQEGIAAFLGKRKPNYAD